LIIAKKKRLWKLERNAVSVHRRYVGVNGVRKLMAVIIPAVTWWNIKLIPQVKKDWAIEHNLIKGGIDYSVAQLHTTADRHAP